MLRIIPEAEVAEQRMNPRCGDLYAVVIERWHCGDATCDCHQVRISEYHRNPLFPGATWFVLLAEGEFHSQPGKAERRAMDVEMLEARLLFGHDPLLRVSD